MSGRKIFNKSLRDSDKCAVWLIQCPLYPRKRTLASPIECLPKAGWMKAAGAFTPAA
jgi:hypothetical protein